MPRSHIHRAPHDCSCLVLPGGLPWILETVRLPCEFNFCGVCGHIFYDVRAVPFKNWKSLCLGQSRQLRARKTWTPVRACGPWDARSKLNLLRYCGHMHTGGLRCFYVVSTGSLRCFGEGVVITRTVTVRSMYGPVWCMCEHHTDPYVLENTRTVIVRGPCGSRSWP